MNIFDSTLKAAFLLMRKILKDAQMGPFHSWMSAQHSMLVFLALCSLQNSSCVLWQGTAAVAASPAGCDCAWLTCPAVGTQGVQHPGQGRTWALVRGCICTASHMGVCETLLSLFHLADQSMPTSHAPKH